MSEPVNITFLRDFSLRKSGDLVEGIRRQLDMIPGCEHAELEAYGQSCVKAVIPSEGEIQSEELKETIGLSLSGWSVIEDNSYSLPMML
jgi:hypothetical protein